MINEPSFSPESEESADYQPLQADMKPWVSSHDKARKKHLTSDEICEIIKKPLSEGDFQQDGIFMDSDIQFKHACKLEGKYLISSDLSARIFITDLETKKQSVIKPRDMGLWCWQVELRRGILYQTCVKGSQPGMLMYDFAAAMAGEDHPLVGNIHHKDVKYGLNFTFKDDNTIYLCSSTRVTIHTRTSSDSHDWDTNTFFESKEFG
jgi:hypothetical protein